MGTPLGALNPKIDCMLKCFVFFFSYKCDFVAGALFLQFYTKLQCQVVKKKVREKKVLWIIWIFLINASVKADFGS